MKKVPIAAAVFVIVGGIYLQVRGNGSKVLRDLAPANRLTSISAEKTTQRLTEPAARVGERSDSSDLVSQVNETPPTNGTHPKRHRVTLSWQPGESALTNPDIVGYNVYRCSGLSGNCVKINTDLVAMPPYVDDQVRSGHTYYYATTAVNQVGRESSYSNVVRVVIPIP